MPLIIAGGAGADGKTTVLELIAKYHRENADTPLVIDANPDQNLASYFGLSDIDEAAIPKICEHWEDIRDALEGENPDYPNKEFIVDTSPVMSGSELWSPANEQDPIMAKFAHVHDGIRFMRTGTYEAKDIGAGCLHDKIGSLVFLLNRMEQPQEKAPLVLVDNAHGRDAFGTPLYALGDMVLIVARPEKKSLDIMLDYLKMADEVSKDIGFDVPVAVIGNRFSQDPDIYQAQERIFREYAGDAFVAALQDDDVLDRGMSGQIASLVRSGFNLAASSGSDILAHLDATNKGPEISALSAHNREALEHIHAHMVASKPDLERTRKWTELCLGRAEYLDQLVDPSVREQKSDLGSCGHHHHHHGNCGHHHHG